MMPIDATGYQQLPALDEADASNTDSDSEAFAALNPRLPHSNLPAGQRPRLLNGVKVFLGPDASDSDSASEEDSPSHDHASGDRVACRHLALCYCLNSLDDHRHAPSADDIKVLRRASQQKLEQLRNELGRTSRALHIVCARDFGVFVRQCFNQMAQELSAPGHGTDLLRLFYFSTGRHGMALRLVCRPGQTTERIECEVSVYDPNFTDHHVQCVVHNLQDFTARPRDHGLLSYLLSREDDEATRQQRVSNYFDLETNPGLQVMLYELALDEPRQSSAPLETDWSSSARATLYQAYVADCTHLFQRSLNEALAQAAEGPFPQQLKEAMGFDHSLLVHILLPWVDSLAQLPRWRAVWAQANDELKAHLAAAHDRHGNPLGFLEASSLKPEAVAAWIDVLQSMAPSLALKALSARDSNGNPGLWRALSHDEALRALDPVLQRCAHELPEEVHALLASQDQQGRTALDSDEVDLWPPALPVWVDWLRKWVPEASRLKLLSAPDALGQTALMRAIFGKSPELIAAWTQALSLLPEGDQTVLLRALNDKGEPAVLSAVRQGFASSLTHWQRCLSVVSAEQRAELLAGRDASGRTLLAQEWCEQYQMMGDQRTYIRTAPLVQQQHKALEAWASLLQDLPVDNRLDILAGVSPSGYPAWVTLAEQELNNEIELLGQLYEKHVPVEQREALSRRLSITDDDLRASLFDRVKTNGAVLLSLRFGADELAKWLDPSLVAAIDDLFSV